MKAKQPTSSTNVAIPTLYTRPAGGNDRGAWNVLDGRGQVVYTGKDFEDAENWIGGQRKPKKLSEVRPVTGPLGDAR